MKGNNYRTYTHFEKATSIHAEKLPDLTSESHERWINRYRESHRKGYIQKAGAITATIADISHTGISLSEIIHLAE